MKRVSLFFSFLCLIVCTASAGGVKTSYRNALILAYSQVNSVYEDDNIKLEIYDECLWATNKTQKTIFIDLSQCFLVNNGSSYPMYTKKQNEKKASKAKLTNSIDEFLSIAPAIGNKQNATFICNVSAPMFGKYSTTESPSKDFSDYDKRLLNIIGELVTESQNADPKKKSYIGAAKRHLTEDESISNIGASIAYAFNKKSEDWNSVTITTWVSDVIFAPYYVEMPHEISKKEMRGFGIKEADPAKIHVLSEGPFEFEEDKSPIIVCDWEGNYKKGEFNLATTRIEKTKKKGLFGAIMASLVAGPAAAALVSFEEIYYASVIKFDGANADWGKMTYVDDKMKTEQSK